MSTCWLRKELISVGIPSIDGVNMQTVVFLGLWLFVALQFNKGKLWPSTWTGGISLAAPFLLAWVPVYGSVKLNAYVQVMAMLYLVGTGFWAINKAGKVEAGPAPEEAKPSPGGGDAAPPQQ
jgi:hypothetical protein